MPDSQRSRWIRSLLLGANLAAPVALAATRFQQPWLLAAATLAHTAFACTVMRPACDWFGPVVTRFMPVGHEVWLTIDDGPAGEASEQLAAEMGRRGVRATFFVKGCNLLAHAAAARGVMAAGHTLANHTQTHPAGLFWLLPPAVLRQEIDACNSALRSAGVSVTRWFRSPVGLKHAQLHPALAARDMRLIAWSVRGRDGIDCQPTAVAQRVAERVHPGAIILLHEGRPRSNEAILQVVEKLQERGYSFVIPSDEQLV